MTENNAVAKILAFVSGKGGPGKTVLLTSLAYVLRKTGKKVLVIDTDFMTRGASYFLIGDAAESSVLDIPQASALYSILRVRDGYLKAVPSVLRRPGGDEYDVFYADTDLFKGGQLDAEHMRPVEDDRFYTGLKNLCERFRGDYDYILLDTHGGYDQSSAIPALVADGFVVVLEVDRLSINQTRLFLNSIESYNPVPNAEDSAAPRRRLEGFISNKWIYAVEDDTILLHLREVFGGIPFGNIPWDMSVVLDYGNKFMPLQRHRASDFSHHAIETFARLLGPDLNWSAESREKFGAFQNLYRHEWIRARSILAMRKALIGLTAVSLAVSVASFVAYQAGHFVSSLVFPLAGLVISLCSSGLLAADAAYRETRPQLRVGKRPVRWRRMMQWAAASTVAAVFGIAGYELGVVLPKKLDNHALLERISSDYREISGQQQELFQINSQLSLQRNELQLANLNLQQIRESNAALQLQTASCKSNIVALQERADSLTEKLAFCPATSSNALPSTAPSTRQGQNGASSANLDASTSPTASNASPGPSVSSDSGASTANDLSWNWPAPSNSTSRVVVSGSKMRQLRISGSSPEYPPIAKAARIQGSVRFEVIISSTGRVTAAHLISGSPILAFAALDAIKGWAYEPYIVNGTPVEVDTQVNVVFSLGS